MVAAPLSRDSSICASRKFDARDGCESAFKRGRAVIMRPIAADIAVPPAPAENAWLRIVSRGRRVWHSGVRKALWRRVAESTPWAFGLAVVAFLVDLTDWFQPDEIDVETVAQVVPAIVIAIFVFAVGTAFVVAQVVPMARGTRAVEVLRRRHVAWTISPALALTAGSTLLLPWPPNAARQALATALLVGAVVYVFASTACLLSVLGEATDPRDFRALLGARSRRAMTTLKTRRIPDRPAPDADGSTPASAEKPPRWSEIRQFPRANSQAATNDLYNVVRTLRGWIRASARTGDSRELQEALEGTLKLVKEYVKILREGPELCLLPTNYWHNAETQSTNPLHSAGAVNSDVEPPAEWRYWLPLPLTPSPNRDDAPGIERWNMAHSGLPGTWLANEVGRSVVRAVEFGNSSQMLLDRDLFRLLNTLPDAASLFYDLAKDMSSRPSSRRAAERSAGVMVSYLVEIGLGARRCPAEDIAWYYGPLVRLAQLHQVFDETPANSEQQTLSIGSAAGVLKVGEAIVAARSSAHCERQTAGAWDGKLDTSHASLLGSVQRTVSELTSGIAGQRPVLWRPPSPTHSPDAETEAQSLATARTLEPLEQPLVRPTDETIVKMLHDDLMATR
jgi:hypothetical protein